MGRLCFALNLVLIELQDRHDEPHEIEADKIRASICANHRFNSFAGERTENMVKWHVDGHDYMWAVSEMLESAKEVIFIQGESLLGETQSIYLIRAFYRLVALSGTLPQASPCSLSRMEDRPSFKAQG